MSVVGWYVHHHGAGHLTRFLAVRPHLDHEVVVFSSMPAPARLPDRTSWVILPRDDDDIVASDGSIRSPFDSRPTARGLLHWAPIGHPGHTSRLATIAAALDARRFAAFVVDVSAEVSVFVRLLGVPPVLFTQPGDRTDAPHGLAYDAAERIIAPWPSTAHTSAAVTRIADRIDRVGGVSRFDGRTRSVETVPGTVLVLGGAGDPALPERVAAAEHAAPGTRWTLIGHAGAAVDGWVDDPWRHLQEAEVVVTAAGQNSIADIAAAGARAVVIPQDRPFDEQRATARHLADAGLAVVEEGWPDTAMWPDILRRARALAPDWRTWEVDGAARRAAAIIDEAAEWAR